MRLFKKKRTITEEKSVEKEPVKKSRFYPNSLICFNGPVVVVGNTIDILKNNINSKDYKNQTATLGSKKAENAFLQGYNYALMFLATNSKITKYTGACIAFEDIPKKDQEWINSQEDK